MLKYTQNVQTHYNKEERVLIIGLGSILFMGLSQTVYKLEG